MGERASVLEWISAHSDVLGLAVSLCTLAVWLVYAQLLYAGFRRVRRPSLMLNRGHGHGLDALCIVGNMSAEGIFVQYVIAELETAGGTIRMDVTDREAPFPEDADGDGGDDADPIPTDAARTSSVLSELTYQGPLQSNGTFHIGSFRRLLERLLAADGPNDIAEPPGDGSGKTEARLTVRLIASYGPENRPVGAERTFRISSLGEDAALVPEKWYTRRLSSRAERRELERQIREIHRRELDAVAAGEPAPMREVASTTED